MIRRQDPADARLGRDPAAVFIIISMRLTQLLLAAAIAALYVLHQDVWFWHEARPLVFGFLPVGLAYHGAFCLAAALLMWTLTRLVWPTHLDEDSRR